MSICQTTHDFSVRALRLPVFSLSPFSVFLYTEYMQFQVPQFLEVEDKLFGFLTLKQFLFIAGGAAMAYLAYTFFPGWLSSPIIVIIIPLGLSLAFVKVNTKPFIFFVEAVIRYIFSPRLYIWKKIPNLPKKSKDGTEKSRGAGIYVPPLSEHKLKDMAWSLDIKERGK